MKIIKYTIMHEYNHGTEEEPNIVQTFHPVEIPCSDATFEAKYAKTKKEAYNGEITVEDVPDPVTEPTNEERIAAMEDAMCEQDVANEERFAAIEDALCELSAGSEE